MSQLKSTALTPLIVAAASRVSEPRRFDSIVN
jgi:hypothetical protein